MTCAYRGTGCAAGEHVVMQQMLMQEAVLRRGCWGQAGQAGPFDGSCRRCGESVRREADQCYKYIYLPIGSYPAQAYHRQLPAAPSASRRSRPAFLSFISESVGSPRFLSDRARLYFGLSTDISNRLPGDNKAVRHTSLPKLEAVALLDCRLCRIFTSHMRLPRC